MQYISIVADSYEEAVREAKAKYGDAIRIHSRRDYTTQGGLFTKKHKKCEITCYISSSQSFSKSSREDMDEFEKEAKTPDPLSLSRKERLDTEVHRGTADGMTEAERILRENYISGPLKDKLVDSFSSTKDDAPRLLMERIMSLMAPDYSKLSHPSRVICYLGPTGAGKTTTLSKVAYMYKSFGKKVGIITLDSYRVGAFDQIKAFGEALDISVKTAKDEEELLSALESYTYYDLILVDTMGLSSRDIELNLRLKGLAMVLLRLNTTFSLVLSASMKEEDMIKHYERYKDDFNIDSLVITKLDESTTIGNALSFSYRYSLPILFYTDGQKVPEDLLKASTDVLVSYLTGFGLDKRAYRGQV